MLWIAFLLGLFGFLALALAMDRHHRDVLAGTPSAGGRRRLRVTGSILLTLSAGATVIARGWAFGPVWFIGLAGICALLVLLFLAYRGAGAGRRAAEGRGPADDS